MAETIALAKLVIKIHSENMARSRQRFFTLRTEKIRYKQIVYLVIIFLEHSSHIGTGRLPVIPPFGPGPCCQRVAWKWGVGGGVGGR
jgi:hypothetical protein